MSNLLEQNILEFIKAQKNVKCSECEKEGKRSKVYFGPRTVPTFNYPLYYDEDGNLVGPELDPLNTDYRCSNGHEWTEFHESYWKKFKEEFGVSSRYQKNGGF